MNADPDLGGKINADPDLGGKFYADPCGSGSTDLVYSKYNFFKNSNTSRSFFAAGGRFPSLP